MSSEETEYSEQSETPPSLNLTTMDILWAPKPKYFGERSKTMFTVKRKLNFDDGSSPIKEYVHGWNEVRVRLASCKCFVKASTCEAVPCKCPKKRKFQDSTLLEKKKISIKCKCPVKCEPFQAAQELF